MDHSYLIVQEHKAIFDNSQKEWWNPILSL